MTAIPTLESLPREQLLPTAFEFMLSGMIVTRAMMPLVVLSGGDLDLMNDVAIDEWMGASPVYTRRMRALMGIEGDGVDAIMKALQLDVGFVHQYMDVVFTMIDDHHAEFWLAHCGALLDAEPFGEERVFGMCHTIEDPTFDATALATNPKARIRPIHRPPRTPGDRHPHCHWTLTIDEANDPVGPIALTERVGALALATVPNARPDGRAGNGKPDYRDAFDPKRRLADFDDATLVALAREFQMQSHLLMAASDLSLRDRLDDARAVSVMRDAWLGAGWITSERLARMWGLPETRTAADVAAALALTPILPPGLERRITVDDGGVRLALVPTHDGVLDPAHPGWCGALAQGETSGLEGIVGGISRRARVVEMTVEADAVRADITVDEHTEPRAEPEVLELNRIGLVAGWKFDVSDRTAAR